MSEIADEQMQAEMESIGKPRGRPPKPVDENIVFELARLMCTNVEIAGILRISHDTLTRNYKDILDEGRSDAKVCLRREQFRKAMEGNVQMLIFLGKQYLNQSEIVVNKDEHEVLPWSDDKFTERKKDIVNAVGEEFDIVTFDNITQQES
jgi:hypothetical protein